MGFPWKNWTILSLLFEIFFCWFHCTYYTLCLLWHVIHDNNNIVAKSESTLWQVKKLEVIAYCCNMQLHP